MKKMFQRPILGIVLLLTKVYGQNADETRKFRVFTQGSFWINDYALEIKSDKEDKILQNNLTFWSLETGATYIFSPKGGVGIYFDFIPQQYGKSSDFLVKSQFETGLRVTYFPVKTAIHEIAGSFETGYSRAGITKDSIDLTMAGFHFGGNIKGVRYLSSNLGFYLQLNLRLRFMDLVSPVSLDGEPFDARLSLPGTGLCAGLQFRL
jgi:hypothetical protein